MGKLFMFVVFCGAAGYLVWDRNQPKHDLVVAPAPPAINIAPAPVFAESEIRKVRQSLQDADPEVRWAAVQLLFNIHDPKLAQVLEHMLTQDPDPEVRMKVVTLFKGREDLARLGALVRGLSDVDKGVRIASLHALGDIGDPSVATWVTALLKDVEPDVRIEALRTLGRFQDKRKAEFQALADKLRADYEAAVRRAANR